MIPPAGDERLVKPAGLFIAIAAFVVTRGLLIDVVYWSRDQPRALAALRFVPLVLGLGIAVFGVSLALSTRDRRFGRTVARWYLFGSLWMLLLVGVVVIGSGTQVERLPQSGVLATAVVGGGVGGIVMGIRSGRHNRSSETLRRQTEQSRLLNRLLRHEVLNAVTAIRGHAELLTRENAPAESYDAVTKNVKRIERTINDVGFIVRTADETDSSLGPVDVVDVFQQCQQRLSGTESSLSIDSVSTPVHVRADSHLETAVEQLLTTAIGRTPGTVIRVDIDADDTTATVHISGDGEWLKDEEVDVLLNGLPEYDTPGVDFGITIPRLIVSQYGGDIAVTERQAGTAISLQLPRVGEQETQADTPGVDSVSLRNGGVAGIFAGLVMGGIFQFLSGEMAIIGSLYGVETITVGWVTHLFHSVIFAILFVPLRTRSRFGKSMDSLAGAVTLAVLYGLALWLVAAGVVMGIWLNLVGITSPIPNLGIVSLVGHLSWGVTLGIAYAVLSDTVWVTRTMSGVLSNAGLRDR